MIVCIETATSLCSVALCSRERIIATRESNEGKSHASMLTVFIGEMLKENGLRVADLEAVAVGKGPGSYTGLRIGVSVAKGLAYGASLPLIGIETTMSMFHGISEKVKSRYTDASDILFCPMIDARRMEVFSALYDFSGRTVKEISAEIISTSSYRDIPESKKIIFFGDGASKCRGVISRENILFEDDFRISASFMQIPAYRAFDGRQFEDVAYFEPFYLKDFITTVPRKNILGN